MTTTHRIYWDTDGTPIVKCEGGDRESECHWFPDCDCEFWEGPGLHVHGYVRHEHQCWIVNYLNAGGSVAADSYWPFDEGGEEDGCPRRDGLIIASFEGDYMTWHYADEIENHSGAQADEPRGLGS